MTNRLQTIVYNVLYVLDFMSGERHTEIRLRLGSIGLSGFGIRIVRIRELARIKLVLGDLQKSESIVVCAARNDMLTVTKVTLYYPPPIFRISS